MPYALSAIVHLITMEPLVVTVPLQTVWAVQEFLLSAMPVRQDMHSIVAYVVSS